MTTVDFRPLRVLVAGLGQMGQSHAQAYHDNPAFTIVGLFDRAPADLPRDLADYPHVPSFAAGLALRPDVVSINTYSDSHAALARAIAEDLDLTVHHDDALRSLGIVLCAEQSMRERRAIDL